MNDLYYELRAEIHAMNLSRATLESRLARALAQLHPYDENSFGHHVDPLLARAEYRRETREKRTLISHHTDTKPGGELNHRGA